jgi:S1-C subfamily serine protease
VIRALDGTATPGRADLVTHLALSTSPGDEVTVRLARGGDVLERTVTLGARPPP